MLFYALVISFPVIQEFPFTIHWFGYECKFKLKVIMMSIEELEDSDSLKHKYFIFMELLDKL